MADELVKHPGSGDRLNIRLSARLLAVAALTALAVFIVLLMPDVALAATASSRPPKSLLSALTTVAGLGIFTLGIPALAFGIFLATRRAWLAVGVPVLAVLPFSAFFQWQNPAISSALGKLFAIAGTVAAIALLAAGGVGLARLLTKEASRIGAAATALA